MMKILSIDQSLNCSGYCICESDNLNLIKCTFYKPKYVKSVEKNVKFFDKYVKSVEKMYKICVFFNQIIQEENIDLVLLEDVQSQLSIKTFKLLAMLLGALIEVVNENQCEYMIIPPATWRKILNPKKGMKRKELKELSKQYVRDRFNLEVNDDVADSICMLCYFIENYEEEN